MDRYTSNTLRTLGIIFTSLLVLLAGAWILLVSLCFGIITTADRQHGAATPPTDYAKFITIIAMMAAPAVAIIVGGIMVIAYLSRQMISSSTPYPLLPPTAKSSPPPPGIPSILLEHPQPQLAPPAYIRESVPLHLSAPSRKLLDRLALSMIAQILVSPIAWIFGQLRYWTVPGSTAPHNFVSVLLGPFLLYHIPYAILIYALLKNPTRRVLTYSLAVPAVVLFQSLFSLGLVSHYYVRVPFGFLLLFIPWSVHIVVLILAYQSIQRTGLHPDPKRLMLSAVVVFVYFTVINGFTPLFYRFNWR
jgi:hypothetical protein